VPISVPCAFRVCVWVGATEVDLSANPASLRLAQIGEDWCEMQRVLGLSTVDCLVMDYAFRITHTRDNVLYGLCLQLSILY